MFHVMSYDDNYIHLKTGCYIRGEEEKEQSYCELYSSI